jgi:hypothetical protein
MRLTRARRAWAGWLIVALLFVQGAAAAYACPLLASIGTPDAAMSPDMPCAEMMARGLMTDDAQPGLCIEHCKGSSAQATEPVQGPAVPPPGWLPAFTLATLLAEPADAHVRATAERRSSRAPPRPLSVVHCCWRI